jgi:hypothetical protein
MSATIKETLGEKYNKVKLDSTKYDPLDMALGMLEKVPQELLVCAHRHKEIFGEDEYFVGYVISDDPVLKGIRRKKFHAMLFMPTPVPEQAFWLYNKALDTFKFMWCLPKPWAMANYASLTYVDKKKRRMKSWCDAYFKGTFWETIRSMHGIDHLSEEEFKLKHRDKVANFVPDYSNACLANPFDFSKVGFGDVYDSQKIVSLKDSQNSGGKTKAID